jgi:hypothetical protein
LHSKPQRSDAEWRGEEALGVGFVVLDEPVVSWQCNLMLGTALFFESRALSTGKRASVKQSSAKLVEEEQPNLLRRSRERSAL